MMDEIVKMGVTSVTEAGLRTWKEFEILKEMYNDGELKVRFNILLASRLLDCAIEKGIRSSYGDEWIIITGVKLYSDGWLSPRTAALEEPYSDFPGRDILFYDYEKALELVRKAHCAGLRVSTHAIGDRAIKMILRAYDEVLNGGGNSNHRFTIEHVTIMPENDLRRVMKDLNVTASIQLSFAANDCKRVRRILGKDRIRNWNIWKTLQDHGIKCVGGSDYPIVTVSPLWGIQRIVTRKDVDGSSEGCNPSEKINVEEALRLITINAAYNSFEENIKGSLEVGRLADLVVLQKDIIEMGKVEKGKAGEDDVYDIHNVKVDMTIINGKIVYLDPESSLYPFTKG